MCKENALGYYGYQARLANHFAVVVQTLLTTVVNYMRFKIRVVVTPRDFLTFVALCNC